MRCTRLCSTLMLLALFLLSCSSGTDTLQQPLPGTLPALQGEWVNMVVEIPAGTNKKIEYDKASGQFRADQRNGADRIIDFLPYPGNYGFIPGTALPVADGGDGDAVDVLLISESLPTGTQIVVRPVGALRLLDEGQVDVKVIAIPADSALQVISPADFTDFSIRYDGARHLIESWFLQYDGLGAHQLQGWVDEERALAFIKASVAE
ncbi:inorganic diphosphatase [Phaeodactylibacter luteus]|uniref:inorganic diphosphatase n=1 Tax=Phaeodactylibacter luteus TaxID=1564516 RepID=A0A5C6RLY6_9BACT|nr:inorganic diphosphatase [Phaeodactylibacter luteus]TXB63346.1 inorganic diphosphatase [Phaeodactylibacter luteus]